MSGPVSDFDYVQPFQVERPGIRGRLVRIGCTTLAPIFDSGRYPPAVSRLLAETLALAAALASGLKYDGIFTLQLQGSGPVRLVVVDITSGGDVRAYARFEAACIPEQVGHGDVVPRLLGGGYMAFIVDQGPDTDRYQGITELAGGSLNDCAHAYFRQSEQLETAIHLCAVNDSHMAGGWRAAALMIQRLPPAIAGNDAARGNAHDVFAEISGRGPYHFENDAEDDWRRSVILMSSATSAELLDPWLPAAELLYRLFHEDGVRLFRQRVVRHQCRCSRQRVEQTLGAFPLAELRTMTERGMLTVTCEFCGHSYVLTADELAALTAQR